MTDRKTALVLEDEPIIGFALEDMLIELGFAEVRLATTLSQARELVESATPDTAVLDVNIHGERSYGVATALAQAQVPFVFATGYGDSEHPEALRSVPTLTKPYNLEGLREALRAAGVLTTP